MSTVLILTGMHRSATSLVASLFQRAGVHIGTQLLAPNSQNPRGFFEDVEFYDFHQAILRARGKNILVDRTFTFEPTAEEMTGAEVLLGSRASYALWGWKDPRTSLFLEFWRERLQAAGQTAHFLLVYRHPFDVLLSMMRRNEWYMLGLYEGLEAWYAYNRGLAEFRAQHPGQTLLCSNYTVIERIDAFNTCLQERFGLQLALDATTRDAQYHPGELNRVRLPRAAETVLQQVHPEAMALYARLNELADLPVSETAPPPGSPETAALAQFAGHLNAPALAARRGLLFALLGVIQPHALETYIARQTDELELLRQERDENTVLREAWEKTAQERAAVIQAQQAWAQERMNELAKLEANPITRALKKLGAA